ncbi:TPA: hypothetical protein DEG21_05395 [Patescibacteria group bacterium]|nr:hypothetical protein [Candidatus Gracilibacteria bacterium]HBY75259.1 hypothetical protein [Candidatus Gracilibacteria bacterium]
MLLPEKSKLKPFSLILSSQLTMQKLLHLAGFTSARQAKIQSVRQFTHPLDSTFQRIILYISGFNLALPGKPTVLSKTR